VDLLEELIHIFIDFGPELGDPALFDPIELVLETHEIVFEALHEFHYDRPQVDCLVLAVFVHPADLTDVCFSAGLAHLSLGEVVF